MGLSKTELFEAFCVKYLGSYLKHPIRGFHRELIGLIVNKRLAIAAPRSFAKSSYFSFFYPLFLALREPGVKILLVSATGALAETWLAKIRKELETNTLIVRNYGAQYESSKWSNEEIHLVNGSVIMAKGAEKQIRGFRPDVVVGDDLETDEMVVSADRRKKFDDWFWTDLLGTLKDDGQMIVVGTILHPESFLAEMVNKTNREHDLSEWTAKIYAAIKEDGSALWPDEWSIEKLNRRRAEMGTYNFAAEYMNDPIPDDRRKFQKQWLHTYESVPEGLVYFTTVDPAISLKDAADSTAIVTCGVDVDRNIYVVDVINKKMLPSETIDTIFAVFARFRPSIVGIEVVGYQMKLKYDMEQERIKRGLFPVIRELKSEGRRKELRIEALQPFFEGEKIFIKESQQELITQLLRFPSTRCKDDIIDALAYQLDIIHPAQEKAENYPPNSVIAEILSARRGRNATEYFGN